LGPKKVEKKSRVRLREEEQNQMFRNIHYSKGDLNEHTQPMKQVNLEEAVMK